MKISDRLTGVFLVLLGLAAYWGGSQFPPVPGQQVGPSAFPMVIGVGLMLVGALIALHIGRGFEEVAEAELAKHTVPDPEAEAFTASRRWFALLPPGLMIFYYFLSERLGFVVTATLMIVVLATCFGAKIKHVIPVSIMGALGIYLVFTKVLRVPLAPGLLPLPW